MPLLKLRTSLQRIRCYSSNAILFMVGFDPSIGRYRILEVNRLQHDASIGEPQLNIQQDPESFTPGRLRRRMEELHRQHADLSLSCDNVFGIFGFIKLLESYYLILITEANKVGTLAGHYVYSIAKTTMIPVSNRRPSTDETKYRSIVNGMDLTKGFYFSYSYDITNTLQHNMTVYPRAQRDKHAGAEHDTTPEYIRCNEMFVWNAFLLQPLLSLNELCVTEVGLDAWILPVIHGYFDQRSFRLFGGEVVKLTLVSRRSRHFAGCRYLRRGVNEKGFVANEVESEQILSREPNGYCIRQRHAAMVQMRGSIPLFWSHTNYFNPKPDIQLDGNAADIGSTRRHFMRLFKRYGAHVTCISLLRQVEKKAKESMLGGVFGQVIGVVNTGLKSTASSAAAEESTAESDSDAEPDELSTAPTSTLAPGQNRFSVSTVSAEDAVLAMIQSQEGLPIDYITYDFLHNSSKAKERGVSVFDALAQLSESIYPGIGCFIESSDDNYIPFIGNADELLAQARRGQGIKQFGVLRTNCIDCLDRTNVAQFCYARVSLIHMLHALGLELHPGAQAEVWRILMEMWAENGDQMARQYGGSGAMHKVDDVAGEVDGERELVLTGGAKNAIVAVQRYYSNALTDFERQQAMDLLLGIYVPNRGEKNLWEIRLRPEDYKERTNADALLAEADERESRAEAAALRGITTSIYLRANGRWTTFSHDGQLAGEFTSFDEITQQAFQNFALDDVTYYPWSPPVRPPISNANRPKSTTFTPEAPPLSALLEDESMKQFYTNYVSFQSLAPSSAPRPQKSTASPAPTPGSYTERLHARKTIASVRHLTDEGVAIATPTHHSIPPAAASPRPVSRASPADAAVVAALLGTEGQKGAQALSELGGVSFFPTLAETEETKSVSSDDNKSATEYDMSASSLQKKAMRFFKRFTADEDNSTSPGTKTPQRATTHERPITPTPTSLPSDRIDDNQRMPPTIHDYIDHVITRSLDRRLNDLQAENMKLKNTISGLLTQQTALRETLEASGWSTAKTL